MPKPKPVALTTSVCRSLVAVKITTTTTEILIGSRDPIESKEGTKGKAIGSRDPTVMRMLEVGVARAQAETLHIHFNELELQSPSVTGSGERMAKRSFTANS